jgi:hypothetical protein
MACSVCAVLEQSQPALATVRHARPWLKLRLMPSGTANGSSGDFTFAWKADVFVSLCSALLASNLAGRQCRYDPRSTKITGMPYDAAVGGIRLF